MIIVAPFVADLLWTSDTVAATWGALGSLAALAFVLRWTGRNRTMTITTGNGTEVTTTTTSTRLSALRALYLGADNRASTSKAVAAVWTFALVFGLLTLLYAKLMGDDAPWQALLNQGLPEEYLLLLGGPYAAAIIAKYTNEATSAGDTKTTATETSAKDDARDLIADDAGDTDLGDFQYVVFNLVALAYFLIAFLHDPGITAGFPALPTLLTGLALTSAGGYAAKKAAIRAAGPQLISVFPTTAEPGGTVDVYGRALVAEGILPHAALDGEKVPDGDVKIAPRPGTGDRIAVTLPKNTTPGPHLLHIVTAAGVVALTDTGLEHLPITVT
jgi:hypothetical protein